VRIVTRKRGVREVKDAMSREMLAGLEGAGIQVASATVEVVGLPPLKVVHAGARLSCSSRSTIRLGEHRGRRTAACVCPVRRLISPRSADPE
jgi:hypothetical protein